MGKIYLTGQSATRIIASASLFFSYFPIAAYAQGFSASQLDSIINNIGSTLQTVIGLIFILATVIFLWGVIRFIASSGDETARTKSRGMMLWGIIGLAVMVAAWGITTLLIDYFGVPTGPPSFRSFPRP